MCIQYSLVFIMTVMLLYISETLVEKDVFKVIKIVLACEGPASGLIKNCGNIIRIHFRTT